MDDKEIVVGLCGDTSNRWADKSLSAIMTAQWLWCHEQRSYAIRCDVSVIIGHYQHLLLLDMMESGPGSREDKTFTMPYTVHFDLTTVVWLRSHRQRSPHCMNY
ncbi:hypothetical protein Pcinc_019305, partial [Petrolisthes cinctipes]